MKNIWLLLTIGIVTLFAVKLPANSQETMHDSTESVCALWQSVVVGSSSIDCLTLSATDSQNANRAENASNAELVAGGSIAAFDGITIQNYDQFTTKQQLLYGMRAFFDPQKVKNARTLKAFYVPKTKANDNGGQLLAAKNLSKAFQSNGAQVSTVLTSRNDGASYVIDIGSDRWQQIGGHFNADKVAAGYDVGIAIRSEAYIADTERWTSVASNALGTTVNEPAALINWHGEVTPVKVHLQSQDK